MQGQRRASVAVGQHQHREAAQGDSRVLSSLDLIPLKGARMFDAGRRIKGNRPHRLQVQRVEKAQVMVADTPVRLRCRRGVHRIQAAEQAEQ